VGVRWGGAAFQFTHAKALVADRTRAWIGVMNWTPTSFSRNRDFAAVTDDAATVDAAETVVLSDWAGETVEGPLPALVVSPVNARATLLGLINQHLVHQRTRSARETPPRPAADGAQRHAQASHRDPGGNHELPGHERRS